ncbi:MAG: hypothetical protein M3144_04605 [Actinomycetota bacterium]|nr:hypothetical protein [Actinomycetota bacterium]
MTEYEAVISTAQDEASRGRYKEAYNTLARALWLGGPSDQECRHRRGLYAYEVAHSRLDTLSESPTPEETLIKAGCWLSRSEAYLMSAAEGVDDTTREKIERELARTKQEQDRFRQLCRDLNLDVFVAATEAAEGD